eukprot:2631822-Amphidinium_carterae.1
MPGPLQGLSPTHDGQPVCYAFNLQQGCKLPVEDNKSCKGIHQFNLADDDSCAGKRAADELKESDVPTARDPKDSQLHVIPQIVEVCAGEAPVFTFFRSRGWKAIPVDWRRRSPKHPHATVKADLCIEVGRVLCQHLLNMPATWFIVISLVPSVPYVVAQFALDAALAFALSLRHRPVLLEGPAHSDVWGTYLAVAIWFRFVLLPPMLLRFFQALDLILVVKCALCGALSQPVLLQGEGSLRRAPSRCSFPG